MTKPEMIKTDFCEGDSISESIRNTKDYSKFRFQRGNRKIQGKNYRKLKREVRKRNLLRYFPILVTPSGLIVDGQHRFVIARELGVSIHYVMMPKEEGIELTSTNNDTGDNWDLENFLYAFSPKSRDYANLALLLERYPALSLGTVLNVMGYSKIRGVNTFKKGDFVFDAGIKEIARLSKELNHSYSIIFLKALKKALDDNVYRAPKALKRAGSIQEYLKQLTK